MTMQSCHTEGMLTNRRSEHLFLWHDPLCIGQRRKFEFTLEIFNCHETTSKWHMLVGNVELKSGSAHNDFYGFGTSSECAIESAEAAHETVQGRGVDVIVRTCLEMCPVFLPEKMDTGLRRRRTVEVFRVPATWYLREEGSLRDAATFEVWKNGNRGKDADQYDLMVSRLKEADIAGKLRAR